MFTYIAVMDGYKVLHFVLLAHYFASAPTDHLGSYAVIIALEAVCIYMLWAIYMAIYGHKATYGFKHLCPWAVERAGVVGLAKYTLPLSLNVSL